MGLITRTILNNSTSQAPSAFQIFAFKNSEDQYYLQVQPGTVNNILPNNIIESNTLNSFNYSKDQINYVILECQTNGKYINSALIKVQNSVPSTQVPVAWGMPGSVQILLGGVYNTTVYQVVSNNFTLGVKLAYVLSNEQNTSLPFVPYYIWG